MSNIRQRTDPPAVGITPEQIAQGERQCREYETAQFAAQFDWLEFILVVFFFWGFALQALIASIFICDCDRQDTDRRDI
jgi:hypothetical protein